MTTFTTSAHQLKNAGSIEEVLCLATLVASGILPDYSDTVDAARHYQALEQMNKDCSDCLCFNKCLACIINQ